MLQCATASQGASKQGTSLLQAPSQPSSPAGPQPHSCSMNGHGQTAPSAHALLIKCRNNKVEILTDSPSRASVIVLSLIILASHSHTNQRGTLPCPLGTGGCVGLPAPTHLQAAGKTQQRVDTDFEVEEIQGKEAYHIHLKPTQREKPLQNLQAQRGGTASHVVDQRHKVINEIMPDLKAL